MKNFFFLLATLFAFSTSMSAQAVVSPALYGSLGGARILAAQGNTAANPAIGFTGGGVLPGNLNDGGGGNGIFRPAANTMAFSTASLEWMRIDAGGRIGMGTSAPNARLEIASGVAGTSGLRFTNLNLASTAAATNGKSLSLDASGNVVLVSNPAAAASLWTASGANIYNANANFVGIGTTTPAAKLDVIGEMRVTSASDATRTYRITSGSRQEIYANNDLLTYAGQNQAVILNTITGAAGAFAVYNNNISGTALFQVNGTTGKASIGAVTTPGAYKLYVEQGILTEKVKVAVKTSANWADYVFAPDYALKSLEEVETFVKANKHLPGVPSAEEVVKEGIDMATMDAKLLEKIEELTLYMIDLKKENVQLHKDIQSLKTTISSSTKQ